MQKIYDKVTTVFSFFLGWELFFPTWKNLNFPNLLITNLLINLRPLPPAQASWPRPPGLVLPAQAPWPRPPGPGPLAQASHPRPPSPGPWPRPPGPGPQPRPHRPQSSQGWTDGWMDGQTDGWTDGQEFPLCSTGLRPLRGRCPASIRLHTHHLSTNIN